MLLLEQNDEWLVGRRYLSETSMALVLANTAAQPQESDSKEVHELTASLPSRSPPTITSYTTRCDLTGLCRVEASRAVA
jgi:hypothetical protein